MVNVFTTVVIALGTGGLGFLVGWLSNKAKGDSNDRQFARNQVNFKRIYDRENAPINITITEDLE